MKPYTHLSETLFFKGAKKITVITVVTMILFFSTKTYAQVKLNPNMTAAQSARVLNDADFKKTSLYATRLKLYGATFSNPSNSFTMSDGTNFTISLVKNPSFAGNASSITPTVTPGTPNTGGASGPAYYAIEPDQGWAYQNYHAQIRSTSVDFSATDYGLQVAHIFPGAIYTFDSYMDGSFQTPSASTRNPITLATDNPNSQSNFVQVANPAANTIHNAIGIMVSHFAAAGNITTTYKYFESNNMADWALKVNAGGSNSGSTLINNDFFNTTDRRHHRYITIDVTKQLYSIFTNPPDNGFYSITNSAEGMPNLLVVGSVNYGIRLLVTMELTFPNSEEANHFENEIGYLGYSGSFDMNYLQSHSSEITKIDGYEIGGSHAGTISINANDIQSNINNILSSITVQNADPVSYRLYDMAWDIIGATASTGTFNYISGTPNPTLVSATVSISCGSDGKNSDTYYYYSLFSPSGPLVASYANASGNTPWANHSGGHNNNLSVNPNQGINEFLSGSCNFRMIIAKPGTEPQDNTDFYMNPALGFVEGIASNMENLVNSFSKDDIHPFTLTLTLNFTQSGQTSLKTYNVVWSNLSISTKSNPLLSLKFDYYNGAFVSQ